MRKIFFSVLILMLLMTIISNVHAQTPQETLAQLISTLQKNPNDFTLREKIIKHVQTMSPAPALPLEAEKYEGRAEYAIKNAKSEADFLDAAKEYDKALLLAPWVSSYYFNHGIAYEKAGKPKEAKQSFELYLLAAPNAQDKRDVRKRIAGLEYATEKASEDRTRKEQERERLEAPKKFGSKLKLRYDGKEYSILQCSHTGNYQTCFNEAGVWPCGCNEAEMKGNNWYASKNNYMKASFPDDTTILFTRIYPSGSRVTFRGRISGTDVKDIVWESPEPDTRKPNKWKPFWVGIRSCDGPLDCLQISNILYDYPDVKPAGRPPSNSEYNPYTRYEYFSLTADR